jgi:hypothetical protein
MIFIPAVAGEEAEGGDADGGEPGLPILQRPAGLEVGLEDEGGGGKKAEQGRFHEAPPCAPAAALIHPIAWSPPGPSGGGRGGRG